MTQKLSFSVEDAKMIQENPDSNFAVLSLDFFASGTNLHDMYVSEETLMRTADSIKNCPIVWKYDDKLDDIYTHDKDEVPCGFVPENSVIQTKKLDDGRTMLSVVAYVWKRYTGELLSLFKRDGGKKPVSVEMRVFDTRMLANGLLEILNFRYEGITVLGSFVTPAIPMANASILSFSKVKEDYEKDFKKEFHYLNADLQIPESVKEAVTKGLELKKKHNIGSTSVSLSFAKYLTTKEKISPDKARYIVEYFSKNPSNGFQKESDPPTEAYISHLLLGGLTAYKWAKSIVDTVDREESKLLYNDSEVNLEKEEMAMPKKFTEEELAEMDETAKNAALALMAADEEETETPAEEKKEGEEGEKKEEKKFEFPKNFNSEMMEKMLAEDDDEDVKMASEEVKKEFCDPSILMGGMFAKMVKMAEAMVKMSEEKAVYMAENEELKKFKADLDGQKKNFEVTKTLKELGEKVVLSAEAHDEMLAEAEKYSLETIGEWVTYCKAKSFDFAVKDSKKDDVVVVGLPFGATSSNKKDDLWAS